MGKYLCTVITGGSDLVVWTAVTNDDQYILAVAAEGWYQDQFDTMQCSIQFSSSNFTVAVNMTTQTIEISPTTGDKGAINIEATGNLTTNAVMALSVLSHITSNNVISVLGNALMHNQPSVAAQNPQLSSDEISTQGLEDSITALIDDLLVAFGASQPVLLNNSTNVTLTGIYIAIRIGSDKYVFAILGINLFFLAIVAIKAWRTRLWKEMTRFNFTDIKSVVVAASSGGRSISETCATLHKSSQTHWQGDSGSQTVGEVMVKLVRDNDRPVFIEAGSQELELRGGAVPLNRPILTSTN